MTAADVAMAVFRKRYRPRIRIPQIAAHITAPPGLFEATRRLPSIFTYTHDTDRGDSIMMLDENGLTIVTVKKDVLLAALQKNLEKHRADYKTARAGYEIAFVEKAEALLAAAKTGNFDKTRIELDVPHSHEREYTRVINMLTMSVDEQIKISDTQFSQYVEDEWNWKAGFELSNATYGKFVGAARGR